MSESEKQRSAGSLLADREIDHRERMFDSIWRCRSQKIADFQNLYLEVREAIKEGMNRDQIKSASQSIMSSMPDDMLADGDDADARAGEIIEAEFAKIEASVWNVVDAALFSDIEVLGMPIFGGGSVADVCVSSLCPTGGTWRFRIDAKDVKSGQNFPALVITNRESVDGGPFFPTVEVAAQVIRREVLQPFLDRLNDWNGFQVPFADNQRGWGIAKLSN